MFKNFAFLILSLFACCQVQGQVMVHTTKGGYLDTKTHHEHYSQEAQDRLNAVIEKALEVPDEWITSQKSSPSFGSPVRKSSGSFVNNPEYFYSVSAFYDHNSNDGVYHDMNCASLSYDRHRGTDFFAFPFYWYQYENDMLDVVAAEEGQIILKVAQADNCVAEGSYGVHMAIRHGNYISVYAHLKEGSLTDKDVNDVVAKGEFLGKVGFTGNSASGPHLHFQVNMDPDLDNGWTVDPYLTTCQSSNQSQDLMERKQEQEYRYTELLSLTTHSENPVWGNACDNSFTENPYFGDEYQIGDTIIIIAAVRDFTNTQELSVTLTDDLGVIRQQWRLDMSDITGRNNQHQSAVYAKLNYVVQDTDPTGKWTIGAAIRERINGRLTQVGSFLEKDCTVEPFTSSAELEAVSNLQVYPNPCHSSLTIKGAAAVKIEQLELVDLSGRSRFLHRSDTVGHSIELNTAGLTPGVYLLKIDTVDGKQTIRRILKQ